MLERFAALQVQFPPGVIAEVLRGDLTLSALPQACAPLSLEPLPDPLAVLEDLWTDPDPENAVWVLWYLDQRHPERAAKLRRSPRPGLPGSPHLQALLEGSPLAEAEQLRLLTRVPLLEALSPSALFNMAAWGQLRSWSAGATILRPGDRAGWMAILLEGSALVGGADWQAQVSAGETLGEMALLSGGPQGSTVTAREPVRALVFDASGFEQLLHQSSAFARSLLRQQTRRIEEFQRQPTGPPPAAGL